MDPFTIAALLGAGASILSGFLGSNAANSASQTQAAAADKATALQAATIAQARQDAAPWLAAGQTALSQYMGELGLSKTVPGASTTTTTPAVYKNGKLVTAASTTTTPGAAVPFQSQFTQTPGYQFAVDQGEKGVINKMSALGMKDSGAALKALTTFRTGLANQTYNQYLDRLSGLSTGGQTTEGNVNSLAANSAANQANTIQNAGAATASGYVGSANALTGGLTNAANGMTSALGYRYSNGWGL